MRSEVRSEVKVMFAEVLRSGDGNVLCVCRQQNQQDAVQFRVWIGIIPMLFLYYTPGSANLLP